MKRIIISTLTVFVIFSSANAQLPTTIAGTGKMTVHGTASIWGDVTNSSNILLSGSLTVKDGARVIFYGTNWVNNAAGNVQGDPLLTGVVDFVGPRPLPYAGAFAQNLNGGGEAQSFPSLRVSNALNLNLVNTATRVRGALIFAVDNGHIISNGNNLVMGDGPTAPGIISGYNPERYFVTNMCGTGHLVRNGFNNLQQVFPVGITENDYTPVAASPQGGLNRISVNVCNYSSSASNESILLSGGVNRTWNIFGNVADSANIVLQHNTVTNNSGGGGPLFYADENGFIVYNATTTSWENYTNPPPTFAPGNIQDGGAQIPGTAMHNRKYPIGTDKGLPAANFTKDFNGTVLPISNILLTGRYERNNVFLNWKVSGEFRLSHYDITRSLNGADFADIGRQSAFNTGESVYTFTDDVSAVSVSKIYYRLRIVDQDGSIKFSRIIVINLNQETQISVYPNPATSYVNMSFKVAVAQRAALYLYNANGKMMLKEDLVLGAGIQTLQLTRLNVFANGQYQLLIRLKDGSMINQRILILH